MSGKLKTLLVVLALGALVSVSYVFSGVNGIHGIGNISTADILKGATPNDPCQRDSDHDGLSDCQETYWNTDANNPDTDGDGFLDGEEVLSGHNPLKKGPNDLVASQNNLTQQTATLVLGALTVGDLDPTSSNYTGSIQKLSDTVIQNYQANSQVPDEDVLVGGNQKSDIIRYGFNASAVIEPALTELSSGYISVIKTIADTNLRDISKLSTTNPTEYTTFIRAIERQISSIESRISQLKKISVPPSMVVAQKNVITLLRGTQQQYRLLHNISQDPMQGIFAFQTLSNLTSSTVADVVQDFAIRLNTAVSQ